MLGKPSQSKVRTEAQYPCEVQVVQSSSGNVLKSYRISKRARDTASSAGKHFSVHWRTSVSGNGPEALPQEWCAVSGFSPSKAGKNH